ncbi:hypothetical protein PORY_001286 [Pneumocystis oryctolagi]|uniref:Uncharacterized protein n=1 Tax=Pneumocystis oryctolagi TaxID=42067 RepID=A0ACB7CBJ9_9ASCO|nr:hypothetical protein PORY_001286 [Pneumocystis oryctolagi]
MRWTYFIWMLVIYSKQAMSLTFMNNLVQNDTNKNDLDTKLILTTKVKEITITMTQWTTHHECITLTTIDSSKVTINTDNDNSKYLTIVGTRDI